MNVHEYYVIRTLLVLFIARLLSYKDHSTFLK